MGGTDGVRRLLVLAIVAAASVPSVAMTAVAAEAGFRTSLGDPLCTPHIVVAHACYCPVFSAGTCAYVCTIGRPEVCTGVEPGTLDPDGACTGPGAAHACVCPVVTGEVCAYVCVAGRPEVCYGARPSTATRAPTP